MYATGTGPRGKGKGITKLNSWVLLQYGVRGVAVLSAIVTYCRSQFLGATVPASRSYSTPFLPLSIL